MPINLFKPLWILISIVPLSAAHASCIMKSPPPLPGATACEVALLEGYIHRAKRRVEELRSLGMLDLEDAAKIRRYTTYISYLVHRQFNLIQAATVTTSIPTMHPSASAFSLESADAAKE